MQSAYSDHRDKAKNKGFLYLYVILPICAALLGLFLAKICNAPTGQNVPVYNQAQTPLGVVPPRIPTLATPPLPKLQNHGTRATRRATEQFQQILDDATAFVRYYGDPLLEQSQFLNNLSPDEREKMLDKFMHVNQYWLAAVLSEMARSDTYRTVLLAALNDEQFRDFVVSALGKLEPNLHTQLNTDTPITEALLPNLFPRSSADYLDSAAFQELEMQIPPAEADRLAQSIVSRVITDLLWWSQQKYARREIAAGPHFHYLFWNPE